MSLALETAIVVALSVVLAGCVWFLSQLMHQNGRILRRLEALETALGSRVQARRFMPSDSETPGVKLPLPTSGSRPAIVAGDPVLHGFWFGAEMVRVYDERGSHAAEYIAEELRIDSYGLRHIQFESGDCVVDIGGHIGLFAIAL